jgi:tetratricopeptide (TPR) repeat protein
LGVAEEELAFIDPYATCEMVPQNVGPDEDPRYVAEVWWQLGNYHFDQIDPQGGPYNLNRAVSAYDHSLKYKKPPLYGVAMYKQAWAFFKQQRYRAAVDYFVQLLHYADAEEARTGDPGADFRAEAFTYIAGSLTYVDMTGPPAEDPFIPRNDVLDTELDPLVAEEKMAIAIERVQDPALIPQDKKWTVGIYKALAREFVEISQKRNAISTMELTVEKFPMDRDAPTMVHRTAELYDELARLAPQGSETRRELAQKALDARSQLAEYVGTTAWTDANRDDPEALAQAEELARVGLQRAAADHTNYARAYKEAAFRLSDASSQALQLERSIEEYRLAAHGWAAYIEQNPSAVDVYDSSFWLADAHFWTAVLQVPLGRMPTEQEIDDAYKAASAVRDSNVDDKYKQPAAYFVVTLSEKVLDAEAQAYEESGGQQGLPRKEEVSFSGEGDKKTVEKQEVPQAVQSAICARDEYNAAIPLSEDPEKNGLLYASQSADYFFVYGQFEEARRRYIPIYEKYCGKNEWGYKAWEKLISMSNFEGDAAESRRLAESKSCAFDEETRVAEEAIRTPVKIGVAYLDAGGLFKKAMKMEDGPARDKTWRASAAAYKVALDVAPDRDEAPEAVMNGAYAYKQVGEYDKAIAMYELFIDKYGDEKTMAELQQKDSAKFEERAGYLNDAYQALAGAYVLFFDYPKAAETFDAISSVPHFPQK